MYQLLHVNYVILYEPLTNERNISNSNLEINSFLNWPILFCKSRLFRNIVMGSFVWDNHEIVVVGRVQNLLKKSSFFDCTLAAGGQYLNAHKLILASSSPYFELLFSQEKERNPIVILKDVKFKELKAIVDFIYYGKTEIPACQVNSFLKTAESLQVFGLIDPTKKKNSRQNESAGLAVSCEGNNSIQFEQKMPGSFIPSICETSLNEEGSVQSEIMPIPSSPKNPVISEICNNGVPVNETLSNQSINANIRVRCPLESQERKLIEINNKQKEISNNLMQCDTEFRETSTSVVERQIVQGVLQNSGNSPESSTDYQSKHYSGIITDSQDNENETFTPQGPQLIPNTDNQIFISSLKSSVKKSRIETVDSSNNQGKIFKADAPFNVSVVLESSGSIQDMNPRSQTESKIYSSESSSMPLDHCVTIKDEPSSLTSDGNFDDNDCNMDSDLMEDDRLSWNNSKSCNQLSTNECVVSAHVPGVPSSSTHQNFYQQHQDISFYGQNNQMLRGTQGTNSQDSSLGKKIYTCPYCKKNFQWLSTLEIHVRTHTGEKPFWCSFCDAKFARKDYLKSHVVSHSGEKRYGCLECGKRFTQKHNLRYHEASHTGVKPFECYSCGRSFSQKRSLNNHLLTHIGE